VECDDGDARDEAIGHRGPVKEGQTLWEGKVNGSHRDIAADPPGEGKIRRKACLFSAGGAEAPRNCSISRRRLASDHSAAAARPAWSALTEHFDSRKSISGLGLGVGGKFILPVLKPTIYSQQLRKLHRRWEGRRKLMRGDQHRATVIRGDRFCARTCCGATWTIMTSKSGLQCSCGRRIGRPPGGRENLAHQSILIRNGAVKSGAKPR
jgi:hypothetical protein